MVKTKNDIDPVVEAGCNRPYIMLKMRPEGSGMNAILAICLFLLLACSGTSSRTDNRGPNIIVIFCDDLGYGDTTPYGHPTIHTPCINHLAIEGQRWTSFYTAASVCTPSRAALLTGRLPVRSGMCSHRKRVLGPDSDGGLPAWEITIAERLKEAGYASACIGKWHLGHHPEYLPPNHGFDYFFGMPYSNDLVISDQVTYREACRNPKLSYFGTPLIRNLTEIEKPANQKTLTKRYTEESLTFIEQNADRPFFLYLAHSMPHVPLFPSEDFTGVSRRGTYGDVVEEIDWSVGQICSLLKTLDLARNTLVIFSSDNGPWLTYGDQGGSAGLLRGGKGGTWEGGMRVPAIFWWPGTIKPATVMEPGTTMDLFTTFCKLSGASIPADRIYDGYDLSSTLLGTGEHPRKEVFFYRGTEIYAIRKGSFKAHFITQPEYGPDKHQLKQYHSEPLLYNLDIDPSEINDVAKKYPGVISEIMNLKADHEKSLAIVENQLVK